MRRRGARSGGDAGAVMPSLRACRVCDSTNLELAIDLGRQPWCNNFLRKEDLGSEPFYPLRVVFCHDCTTTQLDYTVDKEIMFADHTYLSGTTRTLDEHFRDVARGVDARFGIEGKSVLDIGSNDGTQLKHFASLGWEVQGVESSRRTAGIANAAGIPTVNAFFDHRLADSLGRRFYVVNAAGVFFHLEDLHSVTEGIRAALEHRGVFVVQFLYMKQIVENGAFDQIYHEHLLYYTLANIEVLLNLHGLEMFDATLSPIHGGSVISFAGHRGVRPVTSRLQAMRRGESECCINELSTYRRFSADIERAKVRNVERLDEAGRRGRRAFGLGAPAKGNTLLNYFNIGADRLECLVERNPLRKGLYSPGMHIPIVLEDELTGDPDLYYVLAWNFKQEILARYRPLVERGVEFFFPVDPCGVTA
jgi:2-polyprenyl-3-methyl-5-hydroxy-6-metoxy-1,4-benzoquinol methylase